MTDSTHRPADVRHEEPAHALVRASRGADRLLLARPHRRRTHHLGRVARAVLRDACCPVEVVPVRDGAEPRAAPVAAGLLLR
jgi:nucleotide-binding universal stress UspA family protein